MKIKIVRIYIFLIILFWYCYIIKGIPSAVMMDLKSGGLLGDKLFIYIKAKWFAYKYGFEFLYKSFGYSDTFKTHSSKKFIIQNLEKNLLNLVKIENFGQTMRIGRHFNKFLFKKDDTLYVVHLRSFDPSWKDFKPTIKKNIFKTHNLDLCHKKVEEYLRVDLNKLDKEQYLTEDLFYCDELYYAMRKNPIFLKEIRELISPKDALKLINLPENKITVAVHVRMGGEYEKFNKAYPKEISLRVPFIDYYIEQIKRLSEMLNNRPIYVFLFTNHLNPNVLVEKFARVVNKANIQFDARSLSSNDDNILEDLFSMAKFDCLIRPNSSFSKIAQLIGYHKIIISPKRGVWKNKTMIIDHVNIIVDKAILENNKDDT